MIEGEINRGGDREKRSVLHPEMLQGLAWHTRHCHHCLEQDCHKETRLAQYSGTRCIVSEQPLGSAWLTGEYLVYDCPVWETPL